MGSSESKHVDKDGTIIYTEFGKTSRNNDKPAVIRKKGDILVEEWRVDGMRMRSDNKPAYVKSSISTKKILEERYYKYGNVEKIKRENGDIKFYKGKKIHGQPGIIRANGDWEYYKEGKLHRSGAPAIIRKNGDWEYYKEGKLHRLDGPAKNTNSGIEYYVDGVKYDKSEKFVRDSSKIVPLPRGSFTQEDLDNYNKRQLQQKPIKTDQQSSLIKTDLSRKMPENIASGIKEEDRECPICLEIISINEMYTTKDCFCIYHKDCLDRVGKCSICS